MALAAVLVYRNLNQLFGNPQDDLAFWNVDNFFQILLTTAWLWMHLRHLRQDGRHSTRVLHNRHKLFPVWIIETAPTETNSKLVDLFKKHAPLIPVSTKALDQLTVPDESPVPQLIILSAEIYQEAGAAEKAWFNNYQGKILLIPQPYKNIFWTGLETTETDKLLKDIVKQSIRFAEGETETSTAGNSPWAIVGYILVGLVLLWLVFGLGMSFLF